MKLITVVVLALLCAMPLRADGYGVKIVSPQALGAKIGEAGAKTRTIECDFDQQRVMSILAKPDLAKGKFYYSEGRMALHYSLPAGKSIVMSGQRFTLTENGKTVGVDMKSNPVMRQMSNMLTACMTGDLALFGKEAATEYWESDTAYTIVITPTNRRAKSHIAQIVLQFDKRDMTLVSMRMVENATDYTEYTFKNKKINDDISADKFTQR